MKLSVTFIIGGVVMICGTILVGFIGFHPLVEFVIRDQTALYKRNEIRDIYLKIPFPLDFRIYFFNITNPMEVQNGSKPILKEVGPYCYDEFKTKINVVDNETEDSLKYDAFDTYVFNKSKSGNLSDEDYITMINPLLVGMVNKVTVDSPALLSIVNQAIQGIFRNPKSIYLTDKVKNILFDGMELDCGGSDFATGAVCTQLRTLIPGIKESPTQKNVLLFGLLTTRNATLADTVKVKRGIQKSKDLGRVMEVNGKNKISLWASEECNQFQGTDGWIIPPLLDPKDGISAFSTQLCRNTHLRYIKDDVLKGIHVRRYEGDFGDQTNNEADKCYCPTPTTCLKKGLFDVTKCLGAPIYLSLPHFLEVDEVYHTQVEGLKPVWDDHIMNIHVEPMTSAPVSVRLRIQMNLQIAPNPKISVMNNLPVALHPMFWLEDGLDLEGPLYTKIYNIYILLKLAVIMKWIFLAVSMALMGYGLYLHFQHKKSVKITSVQESTSAKDNLGFNRSSNDLMVHLRNEMNNNSNKNGDALSANQSG